MLNAIICTPLLAALLLAFIPRNYRFLSRMLAIAATFITAVLAIILFFRFDTGFPEYQFQFNRPWVESLGLNYHLGVDGINIGLILMAAVVAFAAACVSWEIKTHEKEFYILLLVMSGGILGAFASLDLFFFYAFHELALVPTFIMIGLWGRGEDKNYATFNITLYLSAGALIALIGLIALYLQMPLGVRTFDIPRMTEYFLTNPLAVGTQNTIFALLLFGFGILVSLWPFHTWAPLGYASAPTATSMLHAGVLKKFGLFALIRVALPILPEGAKNWVWPLALLCLGNLLHAGWVAMRQRDLNLLFGNSSVAHMGFAFLGIASLTLIGITGTVLVMVAHGFLAAISFALSGYLYTHTGTLDMTRFGGLLQRLPFIGTVFIMAAMAGCGLPGFANFAGELLVLFGGWKSVSWIVVAAAWSGLMIGAIYMLRAVRTIWHGSGASDLQLADATLWRKVPFALLIACMLLFGIFPSLLTNKIKPSAELIVNAVIPAATEPLTVQIRNPQSAIRNSTP